MNNLTTLLNLVVIYKLLFLPTFSIFRLHEKFPWYPEQLSFLLVNTDSNSYLSKQELIEASKASPDMVALQVKIKLKKWEGFFSMYVFHFYKTFSLV